MEDSFQKQKIVLEMENTLYEWMGGEWSMASRIGRQL
jgi:hypothetical protein